MKLNSVLGLGAALALSGCASIVSDSSYPVSISTSPQEATFEVINSDGLSIQKGRTPTTITLKSGNGYFGSETYTIKFSKEGYEEQTYLLDTSMDGWYIGNILFGGLIGLLIVDPITGAMWKLPEAASVTLYENSAADDSVADDASQDESSPEVPEEKAANVSEEDTLSFIHINQVPEELRSELVRVN